MSDNIYKILKRKYGTVRMRLVNYNYHVLYIEEKTGENGTIANGFVNNQDSSQPIQQITPKEDEAKHQKNFELIDPEMPKLEREPEIKPGTSSRTKRNGETNSNLQFKVPDVPSKVKIGKKRKTDVKSLGATSKKGRKSELPDPEMPTLQREPTINPVKAPENYKCHPECAQAIGKKLKEPELVNQSQRTSKKDAKEQSSNVSERKSIGLKVPETATPKTIKKTRNKKNADSKKVPETDTPKSIKKTKNKKNADSKKVPETATPKTIKKTKNEKNADSKKVPETATPKTIKKTINKNSKKDADSKKKLVQPKQMNPDEERQVTALIKYMYDNMRIGCQTPKPKE